jgi:ABC-2 type transport system ATP-binding protein
MDKGNYSINVSSVTKNFGTNTALNGLTLDFTAGTMHGIIGPEGAGKTTLLRILSGLLRPNNGRIIYKSKDEPADFQDLKHDIAYMPQQQSLYADLSIMEHLLFFKELYELGDDLFENKKEELLRITRLDKFQDRPAGKLSGGMYKKLGLMCSLLREPKILLLDEPTNGVDPISRREFWELLYKLIDKDILIIITTAYMDEAEKCGTAHLIQEGRLLDSGKPSLLVKENNVKNISELFILKTSMEHHK